jgi:site-specific DNA-methyltransferase (adenine-specific)
MDKLIAEGVKVDMILTDPPYGTTKCSFDIIIPFEPMWERIWKIVKPNGTVCLFGSEPFSSFLRCSNIKNYKYDWIWNKKLAGNAIVAKKQPLKIHEIVSIFNSKKYYPQMTVGKYREKMFNGIIQPETLNKVTECNITYNNLYYPTSIQEFSMANMRRNRLHPTQKPVALLEYLVKTYTNEGDTVLDFTMGSGSTGVACLNTNRNFIGIEKEKKYYDISENRMDEANRCRQMSLFDGIGSTNCKKQTP